MTTELYALVLTWKNLVNFSDENKYAEKTK